MNHVLLLIAGEAGVVDARAAGRVRELLSDSGADPGEACWLAPDAACEIAVASTSSGSAAALATAIRSTIGGLPIDVALLPAGNRRKRLLVADMDSTIVTGETLDELADEAGLKDRIAAITARAMNGEIDFKGALRERVALLAGLDAAALERTFQRVSRMPGARMLVATMRANGAFTLLVSGGFGFFTSRVRDLAGFAADQSNELIIDNGRLAGRVAEPILDRDAKLAALRATAERLGLTTDDVLAVGDGANDLAMIRAAGLGVAFRAKPVVAAEAQVRIDHADLTALLYLQGYRRDEFVP